MAAQTRRERQKAETRAEILCAARELFESEGFEQTTLRQIADRARVGLGTIFSHFPDKRSLLLASQIDELGRDFRGSWATIPRDASVRDCLLHLAREGYRAWLRRPALSRVLLRESCFTRGPAGDRLRAFDEGAITQVARLLEQARARGEIAADADSELIARTTFSVYLTTVMSWLDDGREDVEPSLALEAMVGQTRKFLEMLFEGIGPRERSQRP